MKKCPQCPTTYEDSLQFCLLDGSILSPIQDSQATLVRVDPEVTLARRRKRAAAVSQQLTTGRSERAYLHFSNPRTMYVIVAALLAILLTLVTLYILRASQLRDTQAEAERLQNEGVDLRKQVESLTRQVSALKSTIAANDPFSKVVGIRAKIDQGYFRHDIDFTNESGMDLHEIKVTICLIGEDGIEKCEPKYIGAWPNGETQRLSISIGNSPSNVKKFAIQGRCNEGTINQAWTP